MSEREMFEAIYGLAWITHKSGESPESFRFQAHMLVSLVLESVAGDHIRLAAERHYAELIAAAELAVWRT